MTGNNSDFYNGVTINLHKLAGGCDMMLIPDLLERGKQFIMMWLKDEEFRKLFGGDAKMYYYNIACIAFGGGVAFADAYEKDASQIKLGFVDTLLASQKDITGLAHDILGNESDEDKEYYQKRLDSMFSYFLAELEPYWDKEDPRPFLFQGLMAFFQTGVSFRLK